MTHRDRPCSSGKRKFTQGGAQRALLDAQIARALHGRAKRRESRAYQCPTCRWWHLSSIAEWREAS